jgi:hypothetical protein
MHPEAELYRGASCRGHDIHLDRNDSVCLDNAQQLVADRPATCGGYRRCSRGVSSGQYRNGLRDRSFDRRGSLTAPQLRRRQAIEANASTLADGWHAYKPDNGVRWTNGGAAIPAQLFARMSISGMLILHSGPTTQYIDDGTAEAAA